MRFRPLVALPAGSLWLVAGLSSAFISCGDSGSNTPAPTPTSTATVVSPTVTPSTTTTPPSPVTPTTGAPSVTPPVAPTTSAPVTPTTSVTPPVTPPTATTTDTTPTTTDTTSEPTSDTSGPVTEPPTEVTWAKSGNTWSITLGETLFEVDASTAGRITGYSRGGTQVLVPESAVEDDDDNNNHYGSTFTLAPQADSGWPPPEHLDRDRFEASADGAVLTMVGNEGPVGESTLQLTKVFTANPTDGSITIDYQVTNTGAAAATWAPWQVTRVPRNGITFFPTGTGSCTGTCPEELPITKAGSFSFWTYNGGDVGEGSPGGGNAWGDKWVGDGAGGWLAHAQDDVLFLIEFPDVAAASFPPGDGDIAIYASAQAPYVEIEPEGAYAPIAPAATLSWKVKWSLHAIPNEVTVTAGEALGEFASNLASQ